MDSLVKITNVRTVPGFDVSTLLPFTSKVVTFSIGQHGPFTLTYKAEDYTPVRVEQDIQQEVDKLRQLGALS